MNFYLINLAIKITLAKKEKAKFTYDGHYINLTKNCLILKVPTKQTLLKAISA